MPTEFYDKLGRAVGTVVYDGSIQYYDNGAIACITCHYAHGSTAPTTDQSPSNYDLNGDLNYGNDYSTMLKKSNTVDQCEDCHNQ